MTGYTVHTGTSKKFSSGWDEIFGKKKTAKKKAKKKKTKKAKAKQAAKKKKN